MASVSDKEPTSGDFTVLETVSSSPDGLNLQEAAAGHEQGEVSQEELLSCCQEATLRLCGICGSTDDGKNQRPFRIVVVGKHGTGKSSFINGIDAAISQDRWHEYAYTGYLGKGQAVTIDNQKLDKCSNGDRDRYWNVLLPTIIDVAGLSDEVDEKMEELLRLLFYGHIEEDYPLMKVYEDIKDRTQEEVRTRYAHCYPEMRVDRVIYVASAGPDDPLPERLISCVHRAARPSHKREERRAVPIYGVLTKKDKVDVRSSNYQEKKKRFMRSLGLNQSRFLLCSNYCDEIDPENQRSEKTFPELDLPFLKFMCLVCDRALKVVREDEVLPGSDGRTVADRQNVANARKQKEQPQQRPGPAPENLIMGQFLALDPLHRDALVAGVFGLAAFVVLFLVLPSSAGGVGSMGWAQFNQLATQIFAAAIVMVVVFLYQHINRRFNIYGPWDEAEITVKEDEEPR